MKKIILVILPMFLVFPSSAGAVIQSLNSQSGQNQSFVNDTNVGVSSASNVHTINWSGILGINRGGTGTSTFMNNSIPFILGGIFSEDNSNFYWNNSSDTFYAKSIKIGQIPDSGRGYFESGPDEASTYHTTVMADLRLPKGAGSIILRDQGDTEDLASISAFSTSTVGLQNILTGNFAALDLSQLITDNGDQVFTFPNFSGTLALLEANQMWSGINTFSKGLSATTTVNFGEIGDVTSHSCFNTKNTDGNDISFYFVGTTMVVESNTCR